MTTNREIASDIVCLLTPRPLRELMAQRIETALDAKDRKPIDGEGWAEAAFDISPIVPGSIMYLKDGLDALQAAQRKGLGLGYRPFYGAK